MNRGHSNLHQLLLRFMIVDDSVGVARMSLSTAVLIYDDRLPPCHFRLTLT